MKDEKEWSLAFQRGMSDLEEDIGLRDQITFIINAIQFTSFVDIGPGVPFSEAWLIRKSYPHCDIIGLEPHPGRFKNLHESFYPGMLLQQAVGSTAGEITGAMGHDGGASDFKLHPIQDHFDSGQYVPEKVMSTTLDNVISAIGSPSVFVWADVEGAELDVLRGAVSSLLSGKISGLSLELSTDLSNGYGTDLYTAIKFLKQYGFAPVGAFNLQPTHFDCVFACVGRENVDEFENTFLKYLDEVTENNKNTPDGSLEQHRYFHFPV